MKAAQNKAELVYKELSYKIVGILYDVYNELGYGLQEKYYEKAIGASFTREKIKFKNQVPYKIKFRGEEIGGYYLDFLVEEKIILEIKKGIHFSKRNLEQIKGYLKITSKKLAILANFTPTGVKFFRMLNVK